MDGPRRPLPRLLPLILALWLGVLPCPADGDALLPAETCGDYFMVPVVLRGDGTRTLWMLLDTGASHTIVDPEAYARSTGQEVQAGERVRLRGAAAGPLRLHRLAARARPLGHLGLMLGRPLDGILGYDAFAGWLLTIDYPRREVRVSRGGLPTPDGTEVFALQGRRRPHLQVSVGGDVVPVLLDSGSGASFVLHPDRPLSWRVEPRPVGAYARIDSVQLRGAGRLDGELRFGPARAHSPIVEISEGTELIGTDVLRHFVWTFDVDGDRVRILREGEGPLPREPVLGTGALLGPRRRQVEVLHVLEGTPADHVGLRPGDVVTAIDGAEMRSRGCGHRDRRDRRSQAYTVLRDGEPRTLVAAVVELVP